MIPEGNTPDPTDELSLMYSRADRVARIAHGKRLVPTPAPQAVGAKRAVGKCPTHDCPLEAEMLDGGEVVVVRCRLNMGCTDVYFRLPICECYERLQVDSFLPRSRRASAVCPHGCKRQALDCMS